MIPPDETFDGTFLGLRKMKYQEEEHGAGAHPLMRRVMETFGPSGILNPGKVIPTEIPPANRGGK